MRLFIPIAVTIIFAVSATPTLRKRSVTCGLADNQETCDQLADINASYCCDLEPPPFDSDKGYYVHCDLNNDIIIRGFCGTDSSCVDDSNGEAKCVLDQ